MSLSSGVQKNLKLNEQDKSKGSGKDFNCVSSSENQQHRLSPNTDSISNSFFSYIASFYSPSESSDSSVSPEEIRHKKWNRKKRYGIKNNVNDKNKSTANKLGDKLLANYIAERTFQGNNGIIKQKANSANWTRNIRKAARIEGKPYISTTGVVHPGKRLKEPCACRKKCFEKFSEKNRENIFMEFYKLPDKAQNKQLVCSIEEYPKKTVRLRLKNKHLTGTKNTNATDTKNENANDAKGRNVLVTSRRSFSRKYFLSNPSMERVEVCQTMFLNTLAVTLMKVRVIVKKKRSSNCDISLKDGRGKHGKQRQTAEEAKQKFQNHLAQHPAHHSGEPRLHSDKQ